MTIAGYFRLGVLAVIVGLVGLVLWYRADLASAAAREAQAKSDLKVSVAVNAEKDNTIRTLNDRAAITQDVLENVRKDIQTLSEATQANNKAITDLGGTNPNVNAYLKTPIPPELSRLLLRSP